MDSNPYASPNEQVDKPGKWFWRAIGAALRLGTAATLLALGLASCLLGAISPFGFNPRSSFWMMIGLLRGGVYVAIGAAWIYSAVLFYKAKIAHAFVAALIGCLIFIAYEAIEHLSHIRRRDRSTHVSLLLTSGTGHVSAVQLALRRCGRFERFDRWDSYGAAGLIYSMPFTICAEKRPIETHQSRGAR